MVLYILVVIVIIALFLIYAHLVKLTRLLKDSFATSNEKWDRVLPYRLHEFSQHLEAIKRRTTELSDMAAMDNPAWGSESASERRKNKLVELYAQYVSQHEEIPYEDAVYKTQFVVYNFGADAVINDMLRTTQFEREADSEEALRSASFFGKEVAERAKSLKPIEVFEPLYVGITKKNYKKGDRLSQRSRDSYSGEYGYRRFVEDAAIMYRLEELGLLKRDAMWRRTGKHDYILTETDPTVFKSIVFGSAKDGADFDELYFEGKYSYIDVDRIELPFQNTTGH
jgi:hypothetical protein